MKTVGGAARAAVGGLLSVVLLVASAVSQAAEIKIQNANYDADGGQVIIKGKIDAFGDSVNVVATNLSTGALLGEGFTDKQFLYKFPVESFSDVPCEVLVVAGDEIATAEVRHGPGACARYEVTLSGLVTDEPVPFATVSVTLDGVTYTTVADENGFYELDLISANLNQLVRIDASAEETETSGAIDFVNLTGTFSRVLDGDATGNVTNVTTASYVLTVEANGGTEPTTDEELATAETSVDATELFELAALIKLIVDDPAYSLPDGETSLIEFISDPVAVDSFAATVPQEDLDKALGDILADSNLVAGFTAEDIPSRYYNIPDATPGFIARQGDALEFEPGNRGAIINRNINQPFNWSIDESGRLVIVPDSPVVTLNFPRLAELTLTASEEAQLIESGISQVLVERYDREFKYTRVTDGTLVDAVRVEILRNVIIPPIDLGGGEFLELETSALNDLVISGENTFRSSLDIEPIPFTATCPGGGQSVCAEGVWGGEFFVPAEGLILGEIFTLNADNSIARTFGDDVPTWNVDADGRLIIAYPGGETQTLTILDELRLEYGIFSEFRDASGAVVSGNYTVYPRAEARPVVTEADAANFAGQYYNGEVNSWIPGSFLDNGLRAPFRRFGWRLNPDGSGERRLGFDAASDGSSCIAGTLLDPMAWQVNADGSIQLSYSVPNNNIEGGRLYRIRTWYPAAEDVIDGDRVLYVLEFDQFDFGEGNQPIAIPARINIQREIPIQPDFCADSVFDRTDAPAIRPL